LFISAISLENFRNYKQLHLDLVPGFTLLFGENGEGKTNLVESIGYLSALESHRVTGYQSLIKNEEETARLSATANHNGRKVTAAAELNKNNPNRYFLNGNLQRKSSDVLGSVTSVVFAPEDLDIVRRDPSDRRAFLDALLAQLKPRLAGVKSDYDRVLKQRNALLKSARQTNAKDLSTLDIWDDQLVSFGAEIIFARLELVNRLKPLLQDFYNRLTNGTEEITLDIRSSITSGEDEEDFETLVGATQSEIQEQFLQRLQELRTKELERGLTLAGPHRDELFIAKDSLAAKTHASQGEAWSIALGAKLASAELIREISQTADPVIILDDVFSVLDIGRRERLIEFANSFEQVLITSTSDTGLPDITWGAKHRVVAGELVK